MKILSGLVGLIIFLLAISFALVNRQTASISLWPFSNTFQAPLYLLTLGTFFAGLLLGAFLTWVGVLPHRMKARRLSKDLEALQKKSDAFQRLATYQTVLPPPAEEEDGDALYADKPALPLWKRFR